MARHQAFAGSVSVPIRGVGHWLVVADPVDSPQRLSGGWKPPLLLTLPLLFSGIVFSTLLSTKGQISGMMAVNLLGAICGGLLEYNSMYFGFRFLYLIAMGCYLLAFVSELAFSKTNTDELPVALSTIGQENVSHPT